MSAGVTLGWRVCGRYLRAVCLWVLPSGGVSVGVTFGRCVCGCYLRAVYPWVLP